MRQRRLKRELRQARQALARLPPRLLPEAPYPDPEAVLARGKPWHRRALMRLTRWRRSHTGLRLAEALRVRTPAPGARARRV